MLRCDAARCVGAALPSPDFARTPFFALLRSVYASQAYACRILGRAVELAACKTLASKHYLEELLAPYQYTQGGPWAPKPKHESPGRKVIYNQPYAPGAAGRAGGRAGRRSPPRAIWCCTAARDAAESALSSLMIRAHKLMNPKQSPSPF